MKRVTMVCDEYRVSERVTLRAGDRFRVSGGPYWLSESGEKISLASRGIHVFKRVDYAGNVAIIHATNKKEGHVILHVAGRRKKVLPEIVCRPYRVKSKLRGKKCAKK